MKRLEKLREELPYRKCVGIVVFNSAGRVWLGHRAATPDLTTASSHLLWQFPQGGIDPNEKPLNAALRELYEETGITSVTKLAQIDEWIAYDLPDELLGVALKGKYRGQKQKWFAFKFGGSDEEIKINPAPNNNPVEFDDWQWQELEEVVNMVVPFKQQVYRRVVRDFGKLTAF